MLVEVALQYGRTFEGKVLNADLHSDIAVIKIDSNLPLPAAKLGSSSTLCPGEWVVAMGCPLSLQNIVTAGIIRGKIRVWDAQHGEYLYSLREGLEEARAIVATAQYIVASCNATIHIWDSTVLGQLQ